MQVNCQFLWVNPWCVHRCPFLIDCFIDSPALLFAHLRASPSKVFHMFDASFKSQVLLCQVKHHKFCGLRVKPPIVSICGVCVFAASVPILAGNDQLFNVGCAELTIPEPTQALKIIYVCLCSVPPPIYVAESMLAEGRVTCHCNIQLLLSPFRL